jgi:hypothetical protein
VQQLEKCMWQLKKDFEILVIKKGLLITKTLVIEKFVATKKGLLMVNILAIKTLAIKKGNI